MESRDLVRLVATARQNYAGRNLRVGDEFEVSPEEAADLVAMDFARQIPKIKSLVVDDVVNVIVDSKSRYQHRSLRVKR